MTATAVASQFIPMYTILSEIEILEGEYSDAFKSAYGFRPRGMGMPETAAELRSAIVTLYDIANREYEEELAEQAEREQRFEQRIQEVIELGAGDRTTALRWLVQEDFAADQWLDVEAWLYHNGFPRTTEYVRALHTEIAALIKSA